MKFGTLACGAFITLSLASPVTAGTIYDGNEILYSCEQGHLRCIHYLAGVQDAWNDLDSKQYCLPEGTKLSELKDAFVKYAKKNPEKLNFPASTVTISAFNEAYPCE